MRHISVRIRGRVQGVFFRASTREKAQELGVSGFVENRRDGSVYLEAEGTPEQLEQLVEWCHEGPPRAGVTTVDIEEGSFRNYKGFYIRR